MRTLQSQVGWCGRSQWVLAVVMAALLLGFYLLGYRPVTAKQYSVRAEMAAKRQQLMANQARARTLPSVQAEVDGLRLRLEHFARKLPRQQELGQFLESIARLREENDLRKWDIHPGEARRLELFCEKPILMKFEADFLHADSFLRQTEELPRLTRVRSISITNKDPKLGQVEVQVAMSIYFSEG